MEDDEDEGMPCCGEFPSNCYCDDDEINQEPEPAAPKPVDAA